VIGGYVQASKRAGLADAIVSQRSTLTDWR